MTGLDKILSCIDDEANKDAEMILAAGKFKASEVLVSAKKEAEKRAELIIKNAEDKAEFILQKAKSKGKLKEREQILDAKREIIGSVLNEAKENLRRMPVEEYFEAILKLCRKYAGAQSGEIIFCEEDLKKVPAGFKDRLAEVAQLAGGELKISAKTRDIAGGFILSYGDIEENCTFDALFECNFEILSDKVNEILFA